MPIDNVKAKPQPVLARLPTAEQVVGASKPAPLSPTDSSDIVLPRAISMERVSLQINEHSPLLSPTHPNADRPSLQYTDGALDEHRDLLETTESKSTWYLILLTISLGGLQIAWTVELSNGTPYLLSLGLSKSMMALVWIAGPLSGVLVQPYVGIRSDNCRISWGRRKPFMIAGALATIVSLLALAWTRVIVSSIFSIFGVGLETRTVRWSTIAVAVFFVYVLDFAINTVQAAVRAFIVDCAPPHQQGSANAWAGRAAGVGNILGYLSGYIHLPKILPFFGNTQFKGLCVIASIALGSTIAISCLAIRERDPRLEARSTPGKNQKGVMSFFRQVLKSMRRLPPQIRAVCQVQLFAWVGWFPFLFYITTYIGQLYADPYFVAKPDMSNEEIDEVWEHATRIGTFALLVFAITSFVSSIFIPFMIASPEDNIDEKKQKRKRKKKKRKTKIEQGHTGIDVDDGVDCSSDDDNDDENSLTINNKHDEGSNGSSSITSMISCQFSRLVIPGLSLRRAWLLSHVLFAVIMLCTFFIRSPVSGTVLVGIIGISWAVTLWAPFALISAEISQRDVRRRKRQHTYEDELSRRRCRREPSSTAEGLRRQGQGQRPRPKRRSTTLSQHSIILPVSPLSNSTNNNNRIDDDEDDRAGVILGLHNVSVSAPQIIATLGSSLVFRLLQRPRGTAGDESVGWVLRIAALSALVAAWLTSRVKDEDDNNNDDDDDDGDDGDGSENGEAGGSSPLTV